MDIILKPINTFIPISPIASLLLTLMLVVIISGLLIVIHELGHLLFSMLLTKDEKITVNLGYIDEDESDTVKFSFSLGRIIFNIFPAYLFSRSPSGYCSFIPKEYSLWKDFLTVLGGPLFSLIALLYFIYLGLNNTTDQSYETYYLSRKIYNIGTISSFIIFIGSVFPKNDSDGEKMLDIIRYKLTSYSEYVTLIKFLSIYTQFESNHESYDDLISYLRKVEKDKSKFSDKLTFNLYSSMLLAADAVNNNDDVIEFAQSIKNWENEGLLSKYTIALYAKKRYQECLNVMEKNVDTNSNNLFSFIFVSDICIFLEEYEKALKYIDLAQNYLNKHTDTIKNLKLDFVKDEKKLMLNKCCALIYLKRYSEAIKISENLLKENENDESNLVYLGLAKIKHGQLEEGFKILNQVLEINDKHYDLYYGMGIYYYQKQEYNKALELFKKSQELNNNFTHNNKYINELESLLA